MVWQLFIHRLPAHPSRARVAVWRELRRLGALPLQQSVVALPEAGGFPAKLDAIEERVLAEGGVAYRFRLTGLTDVELERFEAEWNALREQEYAEIVEECETKFVKEIEFELFRGNLTVAEAEEIEADLEKIRTWFTRVRERDLFKASNRKEAESELKRCEHLLDRFVEQVYLAESQEGPSLEPPADMPWGAQDEPGAGGAKAPLVPFPPGRKAPAKKPAAKRSGQGGAA